MPLRRTKKPPSQQEISETVSTGRAKELRTSYFKQTGYYKTKGPGSVAEEFEAFGGNQKLLALFDRQLQRGHLPYFWPSITNADLRELRVKARSLRTALASLNRRVLTPHAKQFLDLKLPVENNNPAGRRELTAYDDVKKAIVYLETFVSRTEKWPTNARLQPSRGRKVDLSRYYWLGLLVPYTTCLTGEPKWEWIRRWAFKKIGWDERLSPRYWWRDTNKSLLKMQAAERLYKSYFLYHPSVITLMWLGIMSNADLETKRKQGRRFLRALRETCPAIPPGMYKALSGFWAEILSASRLSNADLKKMGPEGRKEVEDRLVSKIVDRYRHYLNLYTSPTA